MAAYQTYILLNLSKWDNPKKPGTGYSLDVVHETQDGKSRGVGVEKVYYKDNGAKRIGKPMNGKDLNRIWEQKARIKELMDHPPPLPQPEAAPPLAQPMGGLGGTGGGFAASGFQAGGLGGPLPGELPIDSVRDEF